MDCAEKYSSLVQQRDRLPPPSDAFDCTDPCSDEPGRPPFREFATSCWTAFVRDRLNGNSECVRRRPCTSAEVVEALIHVLAQRLRQEITDAHAGTFGIRGSDKGRENTLLNLWHPAIALPAAE